MKYLLRFRDQGITLGLLAEYQSPPGRPADVAGIYKVLLGAAQSRGMAPNVIGRAIGGIDNLSPVTFGFNPLRVLKRYHSGRELLSEIVATLHPRGKVRRTSQSLWPQFCNSALSGARFLAGFKSAEEFYAWADVFHDDDRKLAALPLLLGSEIAGFNFALACDFLKELGYVKLAKPDVQVGHIFRRLSLSDPKADDYAIYKAILRVAGNRGRTAYDVDKIFWLVGSGRFYRHKRPGTEEELRIPVDRNQFVRWARRELSPPGNR